MKKILFLAAVVAVLFSCGQKPVEPVDYVDPFIGTGFHGHTYPGATTPFGAVQLSPDNYRGVWDACSGYHYDRDSIIGFSHTHLSGTGCADLADVLFHPANHDVDLSREGDIYEHLKFSHKDEEAEPGYYKVYFKDERLLAELTATAHTGWHRYTFAKGQPHVIVIDLHHSITTDEKFHEVEIKQTAGNEVIGMTKTSAWTPNQYVYFVAQFSAPIEKIKYVDDHKFVEKPEDCTSDNRQAVLYFAEGQGPIVAKVGLSGVSYDSARDNLDMEGAPYVFNFDVIREEARKNWAVLLSKVKVEGGTKAQKRTFYTALYHTSIVPNVNSDVNGYFRRHNNELNRARFGKYYSTISAWDIFRAWLPLSSLIYPNQLHDMVFSCLDMYDATGELPIWPLANGETFCMVGYHSVPFIVSAWLKGIVPDMNPEFALEAMVKSSNINEKGGEYYSKLGYIPANKCREAVSCALEYAYDDWCIARFAESIGKTDVANEYYKRAQSFVNIFDGSTGFFRGRNLDGTVVEVFNPFEPSREYTEANAFQYRFFTPQDFKGLADLLGGEDNLIAAMDELFTTESKVDGHVSDMTGFVGQYVHGNEPSHHITYIYNYLGQPWKTQELTRRMMEEMYQDTPEGISGNEDCGQMSAWYIMTALGLYEVCPGSMEYTFTTPMFDKVTLRLPTGKDLVISADNPGKNKYIQSVEFNGKVLDRSYITFEELMSGGELHFTLSSAPNKELWTADSAKPYSITTAGNQIISPVYYTIEGGRMDLFLEKLTVTLGSLTEGAQIHYTLDGSEPTEKSPLYSGPFELTETTTIRARAFKDGQQSIELCAPANKCHFAPATDVKVSKNGVNFKYYEGDFSRTDDIVKKGKFVKEGVLDAPVLDPAEIEDYYGFIYSGYIDIPETKVWEFGLLCDDGALLQIDGKDVVDNDGTHSAALMRGVAPLEKGLHPFTLKYIESYEGQELKVFWKKGEKGEEIPASAYFVK